MPKKSANMEALLHQTHSSSWELVFEGIKVNNLKNLDLKLPKNKLITITGVSWSGKSSLAFQTIYKEGQYRYIESLSSYLRQFFNLWDRPEIDYCSGLSPAIAIEQNKRSWNSRSTVGTLTEIDDYIRLLFAKVGDTYCWKCWSESTSNCRPNHWLYEAKLWWEKSLPSQREWELFQQKQIYWNFVKNNKSEGGKGNGIYQISPPLSKSREIRSYRIFLSRRSQIFQKIYFSYQIALESMIVSPLRRLNDQDSRKISSKFSLKAKNLESIKQIASEKAAQYQVISK